MTSDERDDISRSTELRLLLRYTRIGLGSIKRQPVRILIPLGYLLLMALLVVFRGRIFGIDDTDALFGFLNGLLLFALSALAVLGLLILLPLMGMPMGCMKVGRDLRKVGLVNRAGEAPALVSKRKDPNSARLTVYEFDPCGIPLEEWQNSQAKIEAALNITIAKMKWGGDRHTICVYAVPAGGDLPDFLEWRDEYLPSGSFTLALGESITGPVTVDLARVPHVLIGGSTGSGKTVLLKLLLMEALRKGAAVYIADFKGGVDYSAAWHRKCRMIFDEESLLELLDSLVCELERRKELLRASGCANIDAFNRKTGEALPRCIFACDEVAEVLDKTGLNKEQKEIVSQIESRLSTIARQGRAFGIHLMLATQRPDANILPGQIKNNIDFRACGRADNVLSQVILDCADAADRIPKDAAGRFLLYDGTVFQAFWFDETQV